jgi:hypothetical protein
MVRERMDMTSNRPNNSRPQKCPPNNNIQRQTKLYHKQRPQSRRRHQHQRRIHDVVRRVVAAADTTLLPQQPGNITHHTFFKLGKEWIAPTHPPIDSMSTCHREGTLLPTIPLPSAVACM